MENYLNYLGCLLVGIFVADTLAPKLKDGTFFENFLLGGVITYGGVLMGSYFHRLTNQRERCSSCGYHHEDSDSDSDSE